MAFYEPDFKCVCSVKWTDLSLLEHNDALFLTTENITDFKWSKV